MKPYLWRIRALALVLWMLSTRTRNIDASCSQASLYLNYNQDTSTGRLSRSIGARDRLRALDLLQLVLKFLLLLLLALWSNSWLKQRGKWKNHPSQIPQEQKVQKETGLRTEFFIQEVWSFRKQDFSLSDFLLETKLLCFL